MPPSYSLVGDYFSAPAERTRAMAVYWLASPLAQLISFLVGGWLYQHYGWRMTFVLMGVPALLLAAVVKMTIADPRAHGSRAQDVATPILPLGDVLRLLWQQRSSRHLAIALILTLTLSLGLHPWYAAFMMRSHGMSVAELGVPLGLVFGMGGIAGIALGGYVAARWFSGSERSQTRLSAVMTALLAPCFALFLLLPRKNQALTALVPLVVVWNVFLAPTFALMQRLVAEEMRATTLAVVMLLVNLIGMGVGPQIVGILSDWLRPALGSDSLRYAMLTISGLALWAAYHFWRAGETVKADLFAVNRGVNAEAERLGEMTGTPVSTAY